MKRIRVAQIGIGHDHAGMIFKSLKKLPDLFEIVGYAPVENEELKFAGKMDIFSGFKKLCVNDIINNPEIDAVAVETEECNLTKYALLAAENRKHIHMDKPGGLHLDKYERLINIVKQNEIIFHTGYMYRYNPCIKELMKKLKKGELGEVISVEAQMNCMHTPNKRQWLSQFNGGLMFYLGCHLVDLILQIQGLPKKVIPLNKCTGTDGVTAQDFGMVIFEYDKGVSFAKTCAREYGGFARRQIVVTGTKGTIELKPLEMFADNENSSLLYTEQVTYYSELWGNKGISVKTDNYDRYDEMMAAFAHMCKGERMNPYTYEYELELYKILLKCCE